MKIFIVGSTYEGTTIEKLFEFGAVQKVKDFLQGKKMDAEVLLLSAEDAMKVQYEEDNVVLVLQPVIPTYLVDELLRTIRGVGIEQFGKKGPSPILLLGVDIHDKILVDKLLPTYLSENERKYSLIANTELLHEEMLDYLARTIEDKQRLSGSSVKEKSIEEKLEELFTKHQESFKYEKPKQGGLFFEDWLDTQKKISEKIEERANTNPVEDFSHLLGFIIRAMK